MTPESATNVQSYDRPEGRISRATTEQIPPHSNGGSVKDTASGILHYDIPELDSMNEVYRRFAEGLSQLATSANAEVTDLYSFDALPDLDALAAAQGVQPIGNIDDLVADFWPEDESVEDFIAAAMEGRHEEDEPDS